MDATRACFSSLSQNTQRLVISISSIFLASLVSVIYQGFNYGANNNAIQVPILQHAANPTLYPNDPFIATLDHYFSVFWWLLSKLTWLDNWPTLFLWLHILTRMATLGVIYSMLRLWVRHEQTAIIAVWVLALSTVLQGPSPVGLSDLFVNYFNHSPIAFALILAAYTAGMRGGFYWALGVAGLAFNINAFMGAWAVFSLLVLRLFADNGLGFWRNALGFMGPALLFLLIASPALTWIALTALHPDTSLSAAEYRNFLHKNIPFHYFIDWSSKRDLIRLFSATASGVAAFFLLRHRGREMGIIFVVQLTLFLIGAILPYCLTSVTVLNMHFLRVDSFIVVFAAIMVTAVAVARAREARGGGYLGAMLSLAGLILGYWYMIPAGLALIISEQTRGEQTFYRWLPVACLSLSALGGAAVQTNPDANLLVGFGFLAGMGLLYWVFRCAYIGHLAILGVASYADTTWLPAIISVGSALGLIPWMLPSSDRYRLAKRLSSVSIFMLALAGVFTARHFPVSILFGASALLGFIPHRPQVAYPILGQLKRVAPETTIGLAMVILLLADIAPSIIERMTHGSLETRVGGTSQNFWREEQGAWRDIQYWAKLNTLKDAVFVVPAHHIDIGFQVFSERSIWVDWKAGGAVPWAPSYYWQWKQRREAQDHAEDIKDFARHNHISFAVVPAGEPNITLPKVNIKLWDTLPIAYRNDKFIVYDLRGGSSESTVGKTEPD